MEKRLTCDVLIVGGGMAGWMAASHARSNGADVFIADKGYIGKAGQSPYASSFYVFDPGKGRSVEDEVNVIHQAGEYLTNKDWLEITIRKSREMKEELESWGFVFGGDMGPGGSGGPGESGMAGSGKKFNVFKDTFGYQARRHLLDVGVNLLDRVMITELITDNERVRGAVGYSADNIDDIYIIEAGAVIICTGGSGMKAPGYPCLGSSTGDGERMAFEAGAALLGKEFVQPMRTAAENTTILGGRALRPGHPLSGGSAVRGVVNPNFWKVNGRPFKRQEGLLSQYNLAYLDLELALHNGEGPVMDEFDGGYYHVVSGGALGMAVRKSDGIWPADMECRSSVPGLFAAGDALGTMQNGTLYKMGGGSIEGCAVSGAIAGDAAAKDVLSSARPQVSENAVQAAVNKTLAPYKRQNGYSARWIIELLQNLYMPYYIAYVKKADRLEAALTQLAFIKDHLLPKVMAGNAHELRLAHEAISMTLTTEIRLRSALFRTESRGMHYREDYPERDDENWLAWTKVVNNNGNMKLEKVPVPEEWKPDSSLTYAEKYPYVFPGEEGRRG